LVFTSGVLIHISPDNIANALKEIYRVSKSYIWGFEYWADEYRKVNYRGKDDLLWKGNFSGMYLNLFKDLTLVKEERFKYLNGSNIDTMYLLKKK